MYMYSKTKLIIQLDTHFSRTATIGFPNHKHVTKLGKKELIYNLIFCITDIIFLTKIFTCLIRQVCVVFHLTKPYGAPN